MLSEISHKKGQKKSIILFTKLIDTGNRLVITKGQGGCWEGEMGKGGQLYGDVW